jgi:type II secretory pathway pseudopilin PulG
MPFQTIVNAPSAAEAETMAYQTLNFAVRAIDAYQRDHGRLPGTLTEVGAPVDPRWNYERDGNDRYRVEFRAPGYPLAYDSASDPDVFFASVRGRHSKGGS